MPAILHHLMFLSSESNDTDAENDSLYVPTSNREEEAEGVKQLEQTNWQILLPTLSANDSDWSHFFTQWYL